MLAAQMSSHATAAAPPDAWTAELQHRIPNLTADQAAHAARSVLAALADNLLDGDVAALADGMNAVMRPGLDAILARRGGGTSTRYESLVMAVSARLPRFFPHHACLVTRIVLEIIADVATQEAVNRVLAATPPRWRKLWPKSSVCVGVYA
jgi:uncharacterized protein (DUF2267 family)